MENHKFVGDRWQVTGQERVQSTLGRAGTPPGWWRGRVTMKTGETFSAKGFQPGGTHCQSPQGSRPPFWASKQHLMVPYLGTLGSHDYKMKTSPETKFEQPLTVIVHLFYITIVILEINLPIKTNKDQNNKFAT